jgi:acetoin utilization protein AcuB
MKYMPRVKSVMTPFPNSVELDINANEALDIMKEHDISHLPTTENNQLIGVISERDIQFHLEHPNPKKKNLTVRDIYLSDPYIADLNEPLDRVLSFMSENHVGSALITRKEKLVGVFTLNDACRSFSEYLQKQYPAEGDDILA